jgi:hypothetical protein
MVVVMEACWITPWFKSLTPETYAINSLRTLIFITGVVLFSHLLIRSMEILRLKRSIQRGLMLGSLVLVSFISIKSLLYNQQPFSLKELLTRPIRSFLDFTSIIPPEFIIIITVLIGFWRGVSLAQEHIGPSTVKGRFWLGIVMFIVFVFFTTLITGESPGEFFYLFLFASLVGMCTARITVVGMVRGGKQNKFNSSWFFGILIASLILVATAGFLSGVLGQRFSWIGGIFIGLFGSIILLIWAILNPILSWLINIFGDLFQDSRALSLLGDTLENINTMIGGLGDKIQSLLDGSGIGQFFAQLFPTMRTIVLISIVVVFIVLVLLWMGFRLWKDRVRREKHDETRSDLRTGNLIMSLLNLLRENWNHALQSVTQLSDFSQRRRRRAAVRIRQIYADLLELCEKLGQPRPEALTPLEFIPRLNMIFPEFILEVNTITQAYTRVRYGLLPETQAEVSEVESAWKAVEAAGHRLLSDKKSTPTPSGKI